jgi:CO/xanthine dehydrogenase Mo-binding subunit
MATVGQSVPRYDILTKVQGQRKYPQDFNMEGQLYAVVVWSAHPHARVLSIDATAAEALPGVVKVLTWRDVPVNEYGINIIDQPVLIGEGQKVRWMGDRIAIVVAESARIAEKARDLVQVEYEPLPIVSDPRQAMQPGAPLVHEERESNVLKYMPIRFGDVEAGFARSDAIVEGYYTVDAVEHAYMQPESALGYIDEQGRVTVIAAAQWAHDDLHQLAHLLDLPEAQVREIVPAIGGAFGGREDMFIQHLVALAAFRLHKPVKMTWTRAESIQRSGKRHPFYMKYRTGASRDGLLQAIEIELISDAGAYASTSTVVLANAATFAAGPYHVPNARVDAYTVYTNNAVTMAMRGFGATQPPVAYEVQMDKLAEKLGMDPVEFRLKNLFVEGSIAITGNAMTHGVGVRECLIEAARAAGWREEGGHWRKPALAPAAAPYLKRGIGVACAYKNVGYSMGFDDTSTAEVTLTLGQGGEISRALVKIGASEVGQGVWTALAQIAAETLGVEIGKISLALVDTASTPSAGSASASRHTFVSGNAVLRACRQALAERERLRRENPAANKAVAAVTYHAREARPTSEPDPLTGQCEPHVAYSYGAQIALATVDVETGETTLEKLWAANDVGKAINPQMIYGQSAGGAHMGVGYALTEHFIQREGRALTRSFGEYQIPTVLDMPREFDNIIIEVPDPTGPFGAKGLGETPTLPTAPAILNAIHDAVGLWLDALPATAERVYMALHQAGS